MASLCFASSPVPPTQRRRPSEIPCPNKSLKPILVSGDPPTFVSTAGRRIVAVGDLHGDISQTRSALGMAGVLSSDGRDQWIGGETVLVQLGDILDRGEDEIAILSLLRSLNTQAQATGGAVFQVNGNHETMNVEGDFRYVDTGAFEECSDFLEYLGSSGDNWEEAFVGWRAISDKWKEDRSASQSLWGPLSLIKKQKGIAARSLLLRPGGPLACELARHSVVLKVDDWVFCHGGLLPQHVDYGLERLNKEVSDWMQGLSDDYDDPAIPFMATRGYDSIVWNRLYSRESFGLNIKKWQICSILEETLASIGAKAMVVGHTPQTSGINCICNQKIWRIDVGMSRGVLNSTPEVLEIVESKARILREHSQSEMEVVDYL